MIGAVDIGGTKIAVGVVDQTGRVLAKSECSTEGERGFDDAMRRVTALLLQCEEHAGVKLEGIGIGCAGPLDSRTGILGDVNNLRCWSGSNPVNVYRASLASQSLWKTTPMQPRLANCVGAPDAQKPDFFT